MITLSTPLNLYLITILEGAPETLYYNTDFGSGKVKSSQHGKENNVFDWLKKLFIYKDKLDVLGKK